MVETSGGITSHNPHSKRWLVAVLLLYVVVQLPNISVPPLGRDSWRETDVLMVARNFHREQAPLFYPRIDARGETSGITGMEFPLLNYAAGKAGGGSDARVVVVARSITCLCTLGAALCIYFLALLAANCDVQARASVVLFLFAPTVFYYGRSAQPDMAALLCGLWALYLAVVSLKGERVVWPMYAGSALLMALAMLLKSPSIIFGVPVAAMLAQRQPWRRPRECVQLAAYAPIALLPALLWYRHALHLQQLSGLHHFILTRSWQEIVQDASAWSMYHRFLNNAFDVYVGPVTALSALAAVYQWRRMPMWLRAGVLSLPLYVLITGKLGAHHFYYGLPLVPYLAMPAGRFVGTAILTMPKARRTMVVNLLLPLALGYAIVRTQGWFRPTISEQELAASRTWLDQAAPSAAVALYSKNDPTLMWFLDRRGWLVRENGPRPDAAHVVVMDHRRLDVEDRNHLEQRLIKHGCHRDFLTGGISVWCLGQLRVASADQG